MFAVQGGIYLLIKTDGELHDRIERAVPRLMIVFFVLNTLVVVAMVAVPPEHLGPLSRRHLAGHLPDRARSSRSGRRGCSSGAAQAFRAFLASSAMIGLLLISGGVGLYPNLIISTIDPAYNLTIFNAASADNTLVITLIFARHRDPVRAALHDRRVLHLPRQDRRRYARLLAARLAAR